MADENEANTDDIYDIGDLDGEDQGNPDLQAAGDVIALKVFRECFRGVLSEN